MCHICSAHPCLEESLYTSGLVSVLPSHWVEVGVWNDPHSIIRAGEGGRVFREGGVLLELSLVHVHREKKKETYSMRMPILMPILVPVIFPCTTAVFCTTATHVAAAVICWAGRICVSNYSGRKGGGDFSRVEGGTFDRVEVVLLAP